MARDVLTKNEQAVQASRVKNAPDRVVARSRQQIPLLQLQGLVGNRAVQRMMGATALQAKGQAQESGAHEGETADRPSTDEGRGTSSLQLASASPVEGQSRSSTDGSLFLASKPSGVIHPLLANVLQPKLQVSEPDDPYEREADAVADAVLAQRQVSTISRLSSGSLSRMSQESHEEEDQFLQPTAIQRQETEEEEPLQLAVNIQRQTEEEDPEGLQAISLQRQESEDEEVLQTESLGELEEDHDDTLQTKSIDRQIDPDESDEQIQREAALASEPEEDELVQTLCMECQQESDQLKPVQRAVADEESEGLSLQPKADGIQRKEEDKDPLEDSVVSLSLQRQTEEEEAIQTKGRGEGSSSATSSYEPVHSALQNTGSGAPMHSGTRGTLEASLDTDLSGVRVHEDSGSHHANTALNARAFTNSNHIWLGKGESQTDVALMAHETTHVLQQGGVVRRQPLNQPATAAGGAGTSASQTSGAATAPTSAPSGNGNAASAQSSAVTVEPAPANMHEGGSTPSAEGPQANGAGAGGGAEGDGPAASPAEGGASDIELLMPEPPQELSESERAELNQVHEQASEAASQEEELPPAESHVADARGAVQEPETETAARGESALMDALDERPAPSPEIEDLCHRIREVIRSKRPPDEDSLVDAEPDEMARQAGGELNDDIENNTDRVAESYDELENPPDGAQPPAPQAVEPSPEAVATPPLGAPSAAPEGVSPEDVSLEADVAASQSQIEEAGMTSEPAELVESGPIAEARAAQGELGETAARAPAEVLAEQEATLAQTRADMAVLQERALEALNTARSTTVSGTTTQQTNMVQSEEHTREQVSARAQGIFDRAKSQVDIQLEPLARTAMRKWEAGKDVLSQKFRQDLLWVKRRIEERHSGVGGAIVGVWDAATGLPDWVTREYDRAERAFGDGVCDLMREISIDVNSVIATCEALIADARREISELFANLPTELQEWAAGEQARFTEQLDQLHNRATETRDNFNQDLTSQAAQAVQEVREEVHQLREAARGLLGRIADSIGRFLDDPAKFIIEGLLELIGIPPASFWALVNRIGSVIGDIADDPLGFANNLASALGQGFQQFFDNFADHILGGFFDWLFSGLGAVGVNIPSDFSLKSIITFFLELMGITWPNIRELLARHIGEENVALIEQAYELIANLIEMGPEGIFEMIKEQLNPQSILDMVVDAAIEFMMDALIAAVTPRVIAMFNPAGAIVQAIEVVFRILSWVFENAARIFSLVETVVGGAAALVAGNIGGMATAVEGALSGLLAPVIDFLAGFLGMGDLPDKIADTIRGFQEWVLGILDRVIAWLADKAKGLLRALGLGGEEEGAQQQGDGDLGDGEVGKTVSFAADGEGHRLWLNVQGAAVTVMVASQSAAVEEKLNEWRGKLDSLSEEDRGRAQSLLNAAQDQLNSTKQEGEEAAKEKQEAEQDPTNETATSEFVEADNEVEAAEQSLSTTLQQLFEIFGEEGMTAEGAGEVVSVGDPVRRREVEDWSNGEVVRKREIGNQKRVFIRLNRARGGRGHEPGLESAIEEQLERDFASNPNELGVGGWAKGHSGNVPDHSEYEPKNRIETKVEGGATRIKYETAGGAQFDALISADQLTHTISGTRLTLKKNLNIEGRGITEDPSGHIANANLNRSHLIADQFLGSGYKSAANLVSASDEYNQRVMKGVEDNIVRLINIHKAKEFNLSVEAKFGQLKKPDIVQQLLSNVPAEDQDTVRSSIEQFASQHPNFKVILEVKYQISLTNAETNEVISDEIPPIGPDIYLRV